MQLKDRVQKIDEFVDSLVDYNEVLKVIHQVILPDIETGFHDVSRKIAHDIFSECTLYKFSQPNSSEAVEYNDIAFNKHCIMITVPNIDYDRIYGSNLVLSDGECIVRPYTFDTTLEDLEITLFEMQVQYGNLYNEDILLMGYVLHRKYMKIVPSGFDLSFSMSKSIYCKNKDLYDLLDKIK